MYILSLRVFESVKHCIDPMKHFSFFYFILFLDEIQTQLII